MKIIGVCIAGPGHQGPPNATGPVAATMAAMEGVLPLGRGCSLVVQSETGVGSLQLMRQRGPKWEVIHSRNSDPMRVVRQVKEQ